MSGGADRPANACDASIGVAFFPNQPIWDSNPYYAELRRSLARAGVVFLHAANDHLDWGWLKANRRRVEVLHFHWIQYHYVRNGAGSWQDLAKFLAKLVAARWLGYRIVWTVHNLLPHESAGRVIDRVARLAMAQLSDRLLVLCAAARHLVEDLLKRKSGVLVTPHGPYEGRLASREERAAAKSALGIAEDAQVFVSFGQIRPYKNVEGIVRAFAGAAAASWRLVIAGRPASAAAAAELRALAAGHPGIQLHLDFIPTDRLNQIMTAADVAVFAFRDVLSSGSVLQAMACGLPVVAPRMGCLEEWVPSGCGILYEPDAPDGLGAGLARIASADLDGMRQGAYRAAHSLSWDEVAAATLDAYRQACG